MTTSKKKIKKTNRKDYIKDIKEQKKQKEKSKKSSKKQNKKRMFSNKQISDVKLDIKNNYVRKIKNLSISTLVFASLALLISIIGFFIAFAISDVAVDFGGFEQLAQALISSDPVEELNIKDKVSDLNFVLNTSFSANQLWGSFIALICLASLIFSIYSSILNAVCLVFSILIIKRSKTTNKLKKCFKFSIISCVLSLMSLNIVNFVLFIFISIFTKKLKKFDF